MADGDDTIAIKVKDQEQNVIIFKIKPTTKFGKVMAAYASKKGLADNAVKFVVDGARVKELDTPASVGLEDGDVVDVFMEMQGGSGPS